MSKYRIEITAIVLNVVFIAAIGIEFMSIADLVGIWWRIASIIMMVTVYLTVMALVLVTNTRRPAGIDPNAPSRAALDPFGLDTEDLWKEGMPERRVQRRRATDTPLPDPATVTRLIEHFRDEDAERPMAKKPPDWALDLMPQEERDRITNEGS